MNEYFIPADTLYLIYVKELNNQIALYRINNPSTSPSYVRNPNPVIPVFADLLAHQ